MSEEAPGKPVPWSAQPIDAEATDSTPAEGDISAEIKETAEEARHSVKDED